ncbi:cytochrome P450 [Xylaria sp. FL0064]|nr:cytochrome P450 [Xylaria sp. FL0064]
MEFRSNLPIAASTLILVLLGRCLIIVFYRLYMSPLARFPGSKLAAATGWYEFYFDYWLNGQYIFEIERMHKKYGPIIRVTPDELSINDANFYNEIYVTESKRRTNNYDVFCKGIDFDGSHLLTTDHNLHRKRRKPLEPFFSRMGITRLQGMLAEVALHLESRLREFEGQRKVVRLDHALSAFSGDIIGRICLGDVGPDDKFLNDLDFAPDWYNVIHSIVRSIPLFTAFPLLVQILSYIPENILMWAYPRGRVFSIFSNKALEHIKRTMSQPSDKSDNSISLFHHVVLLGGGTASTARTIGFASYYILSRPSIRSTLEQELKDVMATWPQRYPSWAELEKLPYLQAIIKESLRLSYGVMHRLPRVSPDVPIQYKEYEIPISVPVGMSAYLMHSDPSAYPSPGEFIPERWMGEIDPAMHRSFVPFCRGSRNCLGMNLAMAEISLALAVLYRPNGPKMELFETDESDVKQAHDFLIPLPKLDTKGVRVLIR